MNGSDIFSHEPFFRQLKQEESFGGCSAIRKFGGVRLRIKAGTRFADLRVVRDVRKYFGARHRVIVKCNCGKVIRVEARRLTSGDTLSCGHRRRINLSGRMGRLNLRHGHCRVNLKHCRTVEYAAFQSAKGRCLNPRNKFFKDYGGRPSGAINFLFVSFEEFLKEVGLRPSSKHSLDRIQNDGHYERGNIRWADKRTQRLNQRPRRS
jgi:hypothetical protein